MSDTEQDREALSQAHRSDTSALEKDRISADDTFDVETRKSSVGSAFEAEKSQSRDGHTPDVENQSSVCVGSDRSAGDNEASPAPDSPSEDLSGGIGEWLPEEPRANAIRYLERHRLVSVFQVS